MRFQYQHIVFIILLFSQNIYGQCTQFQPISLGNDTILCPSDNLQFNFTNLQNLVDELTWENGSHAFTRTLNNPGTYSVEVKYLANNIVVNGDFSQGNTAFNTDYTLGTGGTWGPLSNEGTYGIGTSPSNLHNNFSFCQDHTGGGGNMLVVNGANTPGTNVWCQTITVEPNTDYEFSTWITNALFELNVAQLQFSINGIPLGDVFTTSVNGCNWQQFFETWNSGTNSSATICIVNLNTSGGGNDFAIDDISFSPICFFSDDITITYNSNPTFTLPTAYNACEGETLVLDAENPGFDFEWEDGSTTQTIGVTATGTFSVNVSDDGYCGEERIFDVTFHEPPNAGADQELEFCNTDNQINLYDLIADPAIDLNGAWYNQNDVEIVNGNFNIAQLSGVQVVKYVLTSDFCPADTALYSLDIKTFKHAGNDIQLHECNEGDLILNDFLTTNHLGVWSAINPTNEQYLDVANGVFHLSNLDKDVYDFRYVVYNEMPCPNDTSFAHIDLSEVPNILFEADKYEGCSPLTVEFNDLTEVNGNKEYQWYVNGQAVANTPQFSHTFENVFCYDISLKMTTDNLCVNQFTHNDMICINPDPIANFTFEPTHIFSDDPHVNFQNNSEMNNENEWTFGAFGESTEVHPSFDFPIGKEANYAVKLIVTSEKGCVDSIIKLVPVKDQTLFYVPNTFTPNDDEFNTVFLPVMTVGIDKYNYNMQIYNRWGERIFETFDPAIGWDGTYNGKVAPDGSYFWKIQFTEYDSSNVVYVNGFVNLIR